MDQEVDPGDVSELLSGEGVGDAVRIVDIRSPEAFASGHLPGSENIPFGDLPDRIEELAGADRVITVCPHGEASVQAARLVAAYEGTAETDVESMAGGLEAYEGPLESGSASGATPEGPPSDAPF